MYIQFILFIVLIIFFKGLFQLNPLILINNLFETQNRPYNIRRPSVLPESGVEIKGNGVIKVRSRNGKNTVYVKHGDNWVKGI